jgi:predicted nucleic acid-binding protein
MNYQYRADPNATKTPAELIEQLVRQSHLKHSVAESYAADNAGAFRESSLAALYGEALPVVVDANILRCDIARAVKQGHRTVLTSAANEGALRLYCASHVIDEVQEHGERWAMECGVDYTDFLERWDENYLPLLRLVDTDTLRPLLSPEEERRISELGDPDDVPSVTLALAIQAVYLSEDRRPHFTVYNFKTTVEERKDWLLPLMAASDYAQLSLYVHGTAFAPVVAIAGLVELSKRLQNWLPGSPLFLFGAAAFAGAWFSGEKKTAILNGVKAVGQFYYNGMLMPAQETRQAHQRLIPQVPTWDELLETNSRTEVLTRAIVHAMARSKGDLPTPRSVSKLLTGVPVDTSPARVGKILHSGAFVATYRGCWQLGKALTRQI